MPNINDYVLVRDSQGDLKYYKDGEFFELSEIEGKKTAKMKIKDQKPKKNKVIDKTTLTAPAPTASEAVRSELNNKIQQTIDDIISELKISFTDEDIKRRFVSLIGSRLRNIRSDKELKYIFTVPKEEGGLGLDETKAQVILAVIRKHEEPFIKETRGIASREEEQKEAMAKVESQKPSKTLAKPQPIQTKEKKPLIPLPAQEKPFTIQPPVRKAPTVLPAKPQVSDVKFAPKLMGPIEELQSMDLNNFHRLGQAPNEIVEEIEEKIKLLYEQDYKKGLQAVIAWQQSPVFNIYNQMGVQSLMTGKPVDEVIVDHQVKNLPVLTKSEFEAIIELNKKLGI